MSTSSVLIVGAGAFGLSAALELRARGWDVTLLDPGPLPHPDAATTDISKMIRMDYGADPFYTRLGAEAMARWDRMAEAWGWRPFHQDGFLILAAAPLQPGGYEFESLRMLESLGQPAQRVDAESLAELFPAWNAAEYPEGYVSLRAGWAESGRVSEELVRRAGDAGVRVHTGTRCVGLQVREGTVQEVRTAEGEVLGADQVILAAGSWTPGLLPELEDVMWPSGQSVFHLRVPDPDAWRPPSFLPFSADISRSGWYGFPATADGIVKIANHGKGRRLDPSGPRVVPSEDEERLRDFLRRALPALEDAPVVGTRVCVYCDTFDGDFWIARHPRHRGLTVASGGSGHAFKFTPVLGEIIADVVEERPNPWADRFRWRAAGARRREWARSAS